jgi:hypothetical protein
MPRYEDENEPFDDEIGEPTPVSVYVRPKEDPKRDMLPSDDEVARVQATIDEAKAKRQRQKTEEKAIRKDAKDLGIMDPKSGRLHPLDRLVPPVEQAYSTDEEVEMEEIRAEARKNMKALIPFLTRMMGSENDKIAMDAGAKLFEISFGKIGTMEKPIDPNKDIMCIHPIFYRELEDADLYEVNEID